jgi:hypothetical protein
MNKSNYNKKLKFIITIKRERGRFLLIVVGYC